MYWLWIVRKGLPSFSAGYECVGQENQTICVELPPGPVYILRSMRRQLPARMFIHVE